MGRRYPGLLLEAPMLDVGVFHDLEVLRDVRIGLYLGRDGEELVLLPRSRVPEGAAEGDVLRVFLYTDSEDRLTATTETPRATVGELACLTVVDVTPHGAFLDWGLDKDLFLPFGEMHEPVRPGDRVVVGLTVGARGRVVAGARMSRFLEHEAPGLITGQTVTALVYGFNEFGTLVAVERRWPGMIHDDERHQPLRVGDEVQAWVKDVRPDLKIELALRPPGRVGADADQQSVLDAIDADGGFLALHDKSPPHAIAARLQMSKKRFKKAIGGLYRDRAIDLVEGGVKRVDEA